MRVTLVIVGGKANKGRVSLELPAVIGRSRDAGLTVAHPMISRKHCEVCDDGGILMVRDLGSLNGTFVAGEQINEAPLRPGDQFTVGPLTFRVDYDLPAEGKTAAVALPAIQPSELPGIATPAVAADLDLSAEVPLVGPPDPIEITPPPGVLNQDRAEEPPAGNEAAVPAELDETLQVDKWIEQVDKQIDPSEADEEMDLSLPDEPIAIAPIDGVLPDFSAWGEAADHSGEDGQVDRPIEPVAPPVAGGSSAKLSLDDPDEPPISEPPVVEVRPEAPDSAAAGEPDSAAADSPGEPEDRDLDDFLGNLG